MSNPLNDNDRIIEMRSVEESVPVEGSVEIARESVTGKIATDVQAQKIASTSATSGSIAHSDQAADLQAADLPSHIELYEEQLVTQTRRVKTGEVKITKRIVTDNATADIPITREKIIIEIESVYGGDTRIDIGEAETAEDGSIRMGIYEEQALSCRKITPYQNVSVRKETVSDTVRAQETLRREEIILTTEGNPSVEER